MAYLEESDRVKRIVTEAVLDRATEIAATQREELSRRIQRNIGKLFK